jgi:Protein of unknown function (DUF3618)
VAQQTPRSTASSNGAASARSVEQIQSEIETTRTRLAGTVDEIADRVSPKNVAERVKVSAKAQVVDPVTGPRYERIAALAGFVLLVVAIRVWRSRR